MKAWDIVGYTYAADTYCPDCIIGALPMGEGQTFDGWGTSVTISTEGNLDELAFAFGIDRMDEDSFDSGEFPKVIDHEHRADEICTTCGLEL